MSRPRALIWPRVLQHIDHPLVNQIPLLSMEQPDDWPGAFRTPWIWTGPEHQLISVRSKSQPVARLLYEALIGELRTDQQLRAKLTPSDVNPLNRYIIERNLLPPPSFLPSCLPTFADSFDVDEVAEYLDGLNPRSVTELRPLLDDYYPAQIFEALVKANLHTRLGLKSPLEITR